MPLQDGRTRWHRNSSQTDNASSILVTRSTAKSVIQQSNQRQRPAASGAAVVQFTCNFGGRQTSPFTLIGVRDDLLRGPPQHPQSSIQCIRDDTIRLAGRMLIDDRADALASSRPEAQTCSLDSTGRSSGDSVPAPTIRQGLRRINSSCSTAVMRIPPPQSCAGDA